jgi:hypothetical protein
LLEGNKLLYFVISWISYLGGETCYVDRRNKVESCVISDSTDEAGEKKDAHNSSFYRCCSSLSRATSDEDVRLREYYDGHGGGRI